MSFYQYKFIEISEDDNDYDDIDELYEEDIELDTYDPGTGADFQYDNTVLDGDSFEITLVQSTNSKILDPKISKFINFCKKKNLFDDTFYDYGNIFSAVATKLPDTFNKLSKNTKQITKDKFVFMFEKKYKFKGDHEYIYNLMDETNKGHITWNEFKDFFLPYIKNITL